MKVSSNVVKLLAVAAALAAAGGASAQSKGQWAVSAGINQITPKVESSPITAPALPNSLADVGGDGQPVIVVNYGLTDNITAEFAVGTPYRHEIYGAGAIAGTGQLATVEALPPTAFLQYRFFAPTALFRPYIGLGVTYAAFMHETGSFKLTSVTNPGMGVPTTFRIDNKWTYSGQLGVAVNLSPKWFMNVAVVKTKLRTDAHYSTGQTQHMKLDPHSTMLTVGYKF
jgi:outer membrane protein